MARKTMALVEDVAEARDAEAKNTDGAGAEMEPVSDVFPDFAVSLQEANRRVEQLKEFVREHMVEGEDYGVIPGASNKPTLFKPGAEKLNAIFGLAPLLEITSRVEDWESGFAAYEVKVTLINKRTGGIEAEGIGSCNSRERRYKNQDAANVANTLLKMAKKRALVDATLSATRASGTFTQDLEDVEFGGNSSGNQSDNRHENRGGNRFVPASSVQRNDDGNDNLLTEAQYGAILAIANKVYGRSAREDVVKLARKPIEELSKPEASALIDKLKAMGG